VSTALARRWARRRGRQHEASTLGVTSRPLLRRLIAATQDTRLGPFVTPQTFELSSGGESLASGRREYDDGPAFFGHFEGAVTREDLRGKRVLDLGCGFGGRTVYYAEVAEWVAGIEISARMIERCRAFAAEQGAANSEFEVGFGERLAFPDASFDVVISYDVLEHVQDPVRTLEEVARVLRHGGAAWLVFPSYLGARASHLDYLTQIPALHRIFDLDTVVDVVNEFLQAAPERYGTDPQPRADVSPLGRRALPSVNGMSLAEARGAITRSGLQVVQERIRPLITETAAVPGAAPVARALGAVGRVWLPDLLVGHIVLRLAKP
jgi:SAM-dependent methyltransferase